MAIVYRDAKGSNLTATEFDENNRELEGRISALETHPPIAVEIDYFVVAGDQLSVYMTDHSVKGPYTLPLANLNFRGDWTPTTGYVVQDAFSNDGSVYVVKFDHLSASVFDAGANDGLGHDYYQLMLTNPGNVIPTGGSIGQLLAKIDGHDFNTQWVDQFRNYGLFIAGTPAASERLLRYQFTETVTFPGGLIGSYSSAATDTHTAVSYDLRQNGTSIGSVDFAVSPADAATFTFVSDVTFVAGDILEIYAPFAPDTNQTDIAINLRAKL